MYTLFLYIKKAHKIRILINKKGAQAELLIYNFGVASNSR